MSPAQEYFKTKGKSFESISLREYLDLHCTTKAQLSDLMGKFYVELEGLLKKQIDPAQRRLLQKMYDQLKAVGAFFLSLFGGARGDL